MTLVLADYAATYGLRQIFLVSTKRCKGALKCGLLKKFHHVIDNPDS